MKSNKLEYLSSMEIFRDLTPADLAQMDRQFTMSTCQPGKIFYSPEETGEVLFLLKKGRVQLYRLSPTGKKLVLATLGAGTFFGEMVLVGQGMHNVFAEAVEPCVLCIMSRADVERLMRTQQQVALRIVEALGRRLVQAETALEDLAFKGIPARLASLLLRLAAETEPRYEVMGYSHQDLAEVLGSYRETITHTLNSFRLEGLIEIGRKRITLLDTEELARIAEA
jgi:CRP/FNR family transcriptional regulator, cyclic AMP receptor protein